MAIPNAALQKLLQEVETQAVLSQQKITQTQAELNVKRRDARLNLLTSNELKSLSKDTKTYGGVGKMFVAVPVSTLTHQLESDSTTLNKEISELEKKLHYQEMTYKNSRQHIEKILQSGSRP